MTRNSTERKFESSSNEPNFSKSHRPNQPFQGAAPLRQIQQSPNLNSGQSNQPSYAVQGVYSSQPGLRSPYLNNPPPFPQQQQGDNTPYYASNPSPRSTTSAAYYPSDKPDSMAAATATMQRPYPSIYHTPQSNSPASVTSPQTHDHSRTIYAQQAPQMAQPLYSYANYPHMTPVHQSSYPQQQHPHQQQINPQPLMPYQPAPTTIPQSTMPNQPSIISSSPRLKHEPPQHYAQTPQSQSGLLPQRQSSSGTPSGTPLQPGQPSVPPSSSSAAPGPIPATTPLVVRQDGNGVQWIAFEYSRDRVKMEYTIRCDVESVDSSQLTQEFKTENCVYPRACVPKDQYKGNRLAYETDCNQVGWALADLNPCLRAKRGLIQRAVDSCRNSNSDVRLRSRRVRRQAKMTNRSKMGALTSQVTGPASSGAPGMSGPGPMGLPSSRPPVMNSHTSPQIHRPQNQPQLSSMGQEIVGGSAYSTTPGMPRSNSATQHLASPSELRQAHTFPGYPAYPTVPTTMGPSMPPSMQGGMQGYGRPGGGGTMNSQRGDEKDQSGNSLFGDIPEAKRRKFILVEDSQKNIRVRVKVSLDQIEMSEVPDSYRKQNSVFPRAYFPVQMQSATESSTGGRFFHDDVEEMDDGPPTAGRTTVACETSDGAAEIEVSRLTCAKRNREERLNELGYRLAWGQSRVFSNRPVFLGRALDAFRNKQCVALMASGKSRTDMPSHLETRPGKRRWLERSASSFTSLPLTLTS